MPKKPIPANTLVVPKIQTRAQAAELVQKMAGWTALLGVTAAVQNAAVLAAQERHQGLISGLAAGISLGNEQLKVWAQNNRSEFEGQSLELPHGWLRFRLGNRSLELRAGQTWKKVLATLKGPFKKYRRIKYEADRVTILKDSNGESPALTTAELQRMGVKVSQEETFEVECKPAAGTA